MGLLDFLFGDKKFENCSYEVYDEIITGHYSNVKDKVAKIVEKYLNKGYRVKVGITNRPCNRFKEHNYDNLHGYGSKKDSNNMWSKMIVIYASSTAEYTRKMESYLIDKFRNRVENSIGGGGGGIGSGMQYVYILLK